MKRVLILPFFAFVLSAADDSMTRVGSPVVVEINGTKITLADFERERPMALFQARNTFYTAERKAIEDFADDYVLKQQAQKEGLTVAELLERHVNSKIAPDPTDEAALRLYYEGIETSETFEAARQRIIDHIREKRIAVAKKAYLQSIHDQATITFVLDAPRAPISLTDTPVRGPAGAAVTLVEFADYECAYCQAAQPEIDKLEAEFKGQMAFAYKDLPLPMHPHAQKASEAALCAGSQNKYWEFHDELFKTKKLDLPQLKEDASKLGLDTKAFEACLDGGKQAPAIKVNLDDAQKFGLQGTPSFFLNGKFYSGSMKYEQLKQLVDEELKKASTQEQRASAK
jgi:protein-disulfide isomerase